MPPTRSGRVPFTPPDTNRRCETAYWVWGNPTRTEHPPLIVLHGGPGAPGRDWTPVAAALHDRHAIPVVLYDQIGCGDSTHLRDTRGDTTFWRTELFMAELQNLITHLQINTFDLLGTSDGGVTAITYALTRPQGLRKLIIASTGACDALRVQSRVKLRAGLPQHMQDTIAECERDGRLNSMEYQQAEMEYVRRHLCRLDPMPPEVEEVMSLINEDDTVNSTLYGGTPLQPTGPRKDFDPVDQLHEITKATVPGGVLLTNGRYDMTQDEAMMPLFTRIHARVKWARFAESSHMAHLEEPEAYLTVLKDFLTAP